MEILLFLVLFLINLLATLVAVAEGLFLLAVFTGSLTIVSFVVLLAILVTEYYE